MKKIVVISILTMLGVGLTSQMRPIYVESSPLTMVHAVQIPKQLEASASASNEITGTFKATVKTSPVASGGSKEQWMAQAGIPQSDWQYVDYIVSHESGWNPLSLNASSGACSLVQSLPCNKIGDDWRNPVTALKWQLNYVNDRYGGYAGAYKFWISNNWY